MTTIKTVKGKEILVRGSVEEIVMNYKKKPNTEVNKSRFNENLLITINGFFVAEIIVNN